MDPVEKIPSFEERWQVRRGDKFLWRVTALNAEILQELFESYIYLDIAQNPPPIPGIPNYHHPKINIIKELGNISPENRKFYEFYQEVEGIITFVRDGHLSVNAFETPKGIQFFQYYAILPFTYVVKKHEGNKRLFIVIIEELLEKYDNYTKEFLQAHTNSSIKTINDMDPIEYIQNWSKYHRIKNNHSDFVNNLISISEFGLFNNPLNYNEMIQNEFEFDDNKIIRISYLIQKPEIKSKQFQNFFLSSIKKYKNKRHLSIFNKIFFD